MSPYSPHERTQMIDIYMRERSLVRTGRIFGCSHNTVRAALREAGVPVQPAGGRARPAGQPPHWFRRISTNGYVVWFGWVGKRVPGGYKYATIAEHRLVMEKQLRRPLTRHEEIHHRNGVRTDNRPENLELRVRPHGSGATHCPHCGESLFH